MVDNHHVEVRSCGDDGLCCSFLRGREGIVVLAWPETVLEMWGHVCMCVCC